MATANVTFFPEPKPTVTYAMVQDAIASIRLKNPKKDRETVKLVAAALKSLPFECGDLFSNWAGAVGFGRYHGKQVWEHTRGDPDAWEDVFALCRQGDNLTLPITVASELARVPLKPRSDHVPGLVPSRNVTLLFGDGGTGKSLVALQLAIATAIGRPWFGCEVRQGPALYVSAEDDLDELHRRIASIAAHEHVGSDQLFGLAFVVMADREAILAAPTARYGALEPTPLFHAIRSKIEQHRPALVILDNLADMFGGDENNRAHARQFIGLLRGMALELDTTILLLAHPSRSGLSTGSGDAGSTAWSNSVRSRLYLERDQHNPNIRVLEVKKANYGRTGQKLMLEWRDGAFHCLAGLQSQDAHGSAAQQLIDTLFLELLGEFTARGQSLCGSANSPTRYAPRLMASHPKSGGIVEAGFKEAMNRLLAQGRLADQPVKLHGRDTTALVDMFAATLAPPATTPAQLFATPPVGAGEVPSQLPPQVADNSPTTTTSPLTGGYRPAPVGGWGPADSG